MAFSQNLAYQTVGVAAVFFSLGFLALALTILAKFLQKPAAMPHQTAASLIPTKLAEEPLPAAAGAEEKISVDVRAAIAAAVHVTLGPGHRILDIRQVSGDRQQIWSIEGRRQIFQSHKIR